jgi:hypothetical protein
VDAVRELASRVTHRATLVGFGLAVLVALAPGAARAADAAESELAKRYAPVLRLKEQPEPCGKGEPYQPIDVDWVFGNQEVALRGSWERGGDLVEIAPDAVRLSRAPTDYHLDFPGSALSPGCRYEEFSDRTIAGRRATVYARVVRQPDAPSQLALQYWFYYLYNDFNNKHEGDWEMIQLLFDAPDAAVALERGPVRVGYSQHEGAEEATWESAKLERLDGTHPVVYPASGSHANYFAPALYLGRSAAQGVGCDDTTGPSLELRPRVVVIPSDPGAARTAFPWLAYAGRWGERQPSFYNGPTGPAFKTQWTEPVTWSEEDWRTQSFSVGAAEGLGPSATGFFCGAIARGSALLTQATNRPWTIVAVLGALALLVALAAYRTRWRPSAPLRLLRRRAWGQIVTASFRLFREHPRLFAGIGLTAIPLLAGAGLLQALLFRVVGLHRLRETAGETNGVVLLVVISVAIMFSLLALILVQAATAHALRELDAERPVSVRGAYRGVREHVDELTFADGFLVVVVGMLAISVVGLPVAVLLLGRWAYVAQVVVFERLGGRAALRRSSALVRGHWFQASAVLLTMIATTLLLGPLLGVVLLFATSASFELVNVISSLVFVATMPLVAIATTYVYANLRAAEATREPAAEHAALPAEVA